MMVVAALGRSSRSDLDDFCFRLLPGLSFPCQQLLGASLDLRQTDTSLWTCCVHLHNAPRSSPCSSTSPPSSHRLHTTTAGVQVTLGRLNSGQLLPSLPPRTHRAPVSEWPERPQHRWAHASRRCRGRRDRGTFTKYTALAKGRLKAINLCYVPDFRLNKNIVLFCGSFSFFIVHYYWPSTLSEQI